jgi:hypothetical protein
MNAADPLLNTVDAAPAGVGLEAVLVGNAAAAIHGAPVTTLDFDFVFRASPVNLGKLKRLADGQQAVLLRPHHPVPALFRVVIGDLGQQADFRPAIYGFRSCNRLPSRAKEVELGSYGLWVASPAGNLTSKRAAGRPRDLAVSAICRTREQSPVGGQEVCARRFNARSPRSTMGRDLQERKKMRFVPLAFLRPWRDSTAHRNNQPTVETVGCCLSP